MSTIFRELTPFPIPKNFHVNKGNGRVFLSTRTQDGRRGQVVVGRAVRDEQTGELSKMYANSTFKERFPALWAQYYGEPSNPNTLNAGLYMITLASSQKNGLYKAVTESFGPLYGNAIMDYAMYSIKFHSNVTKNFKESMGSQLTFSDKINNESWMSKLFSKNIKGEYVYKFQKKWASLCAKSGVKNVWLCIDGSNNNCSVSNSLLAEPGKAKSRKNGNIVSYIWAVSSQDGMPVTWRVNNGGMVDSKAIKRVVKFLSKSGIQVEGVILDRGFCTYAALSYVEECGYDWIVMLKGSTLGFKNMYQKHSEEIRNKITRILNRKYIFGITDKMALFSQSTKSDTISLFYDPVNGTERAEALSIKILRAQESLNKTIAKNNKSGKSKDIQVPMELRQYLSVETTDEGTKVIVNTKQWQKDIELKGYYAIASSKEMNSDEIDTCYDLRDISEKQYMIAKDQMGFDAVHVHCDRSIRNKFAVAFIASIVRTEILTHARRLGIDTNKIILLCDERCKLNFEIDDNYEFIDDMSEKMKTFFNEFNINEKNFIALADEVNARSKDPAASPLRVLPGEVQLKPGPKPKPKDEAQEENLPKKVGRKKGSKNKKTLEREAAAAAALLSSSAPSGIKRGPGRPRGSLNKKTLARLAQEKKEAEQSEPATKRGKGRPLGSKNQKTIEQEIARMAQHLANEQPQNEHKGKGRPKGHKNFKTLLREATALVEQKNHAGTPSQVNSHGQ